VTWGGASIIPWRKERYAQDEVSRPENTTRLGKFLAGAFLLAGIVGVFFLARTAQDLQRNDDLTLTAWTHEFTVSERRCTMTATAALRNGGDAVLDLTRIQLTAYSGPFFDKDHPDLADPLVLSVEGTELVEFEVDIGPNCPPPQLFDTGIITVEWNRADEPDRVRTRSLDTN